MAKPIRLNTSGSERDTSMAEPKRVESRVVQLPGTKRILHPLPEIDPRELVLDSILATIPGAEDRVYMERFIAERKAAIFKAEQGRVAESRAVHDYRKLADLRLTQAEALEGKVAGLEQTLAQRDGELQLLDAKLLSARHDELTGLPTRRAAYESHELIPRALAYSDRHGTPLGLIFGDLDKLKAINDGLGHEVGDEAIRAFTDTTRAMLRPEDFLVKWGGDEVVAFLQNANLEVAINIAERMREAIEKIRVPVDSPYHHQIPISASYGVAIREPRTRGPDDRQRVASYTVEEMQAEMQAEIKPLLKAADRKLYEAKASGRNQVSG